MLFALRSRLEFIVTYLFPVLLILGDTLLRYGLSIDVSDVGADMALTTVASFLTLIIGDLQHLPNDAAAAPKMIRSPQDLVIMFIVTVIFGILWLLTLVLISKATSIGKPICTTIVLGIGGATLFVGSRLFYELISREGQ